MKLGTETLGKHKIDIEVSATGQFSAEFNDQDFHAPNRLDLLEQLKKAVKRADRTAPVKVTVLGLGEKKNRKDWDHEYFENVAGSVVDAKLRGRHERNRVWLLESEDKRKFQIGDYRGRESTIVRRLTLAEVVRYQKLVEELRVATTALEDFVGEVSINPAKALEDALKAASNG